MAWCSLNRASRALDCSVRTVQRRIKSRDWDTDRRKGEDGRYRLFVDLPESAVENEEVLGHAEVLDQGEAGTLPHHTPHNDDLTQALEAVRDELKAVHTLLEELPQRLAEVVLSFRDTTRDDSTGVDVTRHDKTTDRVVTRDDKEAEEGSWDGTELRAWRKKEGLSLRALADRIGCHKSAIGRWERGQREPSDENLEALRAAGFTS